MIKCNSLWILYLCACCCAQIKKQPKCNHNISFGKYLSVAAIKNGTTSTLFCYATFLSPMQFFSTSISQSLPEFLCFALSAPSYSKMLQKRVTERSSYGENACTWKLFSSYQHKFFEVNPCRVYIHKSTCPSSVYCANSNGPCGFATRFKVYCTNIHTPASNKWKFIEMKLPYSIYKLHHIALAPDATHNRELSARNGTDRTRKLAKK